MAEFTTVLLDIDETLLDFVAAERAALTDSLIAVALPVTEETLTLYHGINDALWKDFEKGLVTKERLKVLRFSRLLEQINVTSVKAEEMQKIYTDRLAQKGILLDGAMEFLKALAQKYTVYAVTNGISYVQKSRSKISGIAEYFTDVFISEDVGCGKPDPRYFEYVLSRIEEKDKSRIAVVGDSLTSDIKGGNDAGLATCRYDPQNKPNTTDIIPTATAHTYGEILAFLAGQ